MCVERVVSGCPSVGLWAWAKARSAARGNQGDTEMGAICNSLHISRSTLYRYLARPEG